MYEFFSVCCVLISLLCLRVHVYKILADNPALPGYLFIPIFFQTGKGMISICSVKPKEFYYMYIYNMKYNIIYEYIIYIVIYVPSLVEIAPSVPELCWNIHTHKHI
jgi:hypothetical protein